MGIFSAVTTFAAAAVAILTAPSQMRTLLLSSLIALAAVLFGLLAAPEALRKLRARRSLPSARDLESLCGGYHVSQATAGEVGWIAGLETSVYSREDAIPEKTLREWFAVNPTGFSVIHDPDGRPIGHLDLLPLRPATMEVFRAGDIVEREIRGDSLYSPAERSSITLLYVESIILKPNKPLTTAAAWLCLLENLPAILERVTDLARIESIYAIAATAAGERLLRRLNFELDRAGDRRKDAHPLFVGRFPEVAKSLAKLSRSASLAEGVMRQGL